MSGGEVELRMTTSSLWQVAGLLVSMAAGGCNSPLDKNPTVGDYDGVGGSSATGGVGGGGAGTGGVGGSGGGTAGDCGACDYCNPASAEGEDAVYNAGSDLLYYVARSAPAPGPFDSLTIELWHSFGASRLVTSYAPFVFTGENFADCSVCSQAARGCVISRIGLECSEQFVILSGELTLTALGQTGGQMTGTLSNAVYGLATFNESTLESTIIDLDSDGEPDKTWCIAEQTFDLTIE